VRFLTLRHYTDVGTWRFLTHFKNVFFELSYAKTTNFRLSYFWLFYLITSTLNPLSPPIGVATRGPYFGSNLPPKWRPSDNFRPHNSKPEVEIDIVQKLILSVERPLKNPQQTVRSWAPEAGDLGKVPRPPKNLNPLFSKFGIRNMAEKYGNELFDPHFLFDPLYIMGSISTPYALL